MFTLMMFRIVLLGLSAVFLRSASIPPNPIPAQPRPPSNAPFAHKREWLAVRLIPIFIALSRKLCYISTVLECLFVLRSQYPLFPCFLPQIWPMHHIQRASTMETLRFIALILSVAGWYLRVRCQNLLGGSFKWQIAGLGEPNEKLRSEKPSELITSGPYAYVRHPAYAGGMLGFISMTVYYVLPGSWLRESGVLYTWMGMLGVGVWVGTWTMVAVMFVALRLDTEEEVLKKQFGEEWERWSERARWRILPGVW
ncbi:hypothetical protein PM082_013986 [Marasmius tenuissimus]|nr:hypothetical protein PM082_013986 [Marasmius tenuissimus]